MASSLIQSAAAGELPDWAIVGQERRSHLAGVAALMDRWAARLNLGEAERLRWRAAGWLHDALRDASPPAIRRWVPVGLTGLGAPLWHGPAAAARLEADGVADAPLLAAISYHTTGHPALDLLGRALFVADYLEPGRGFDVGERAGLRARMPEAMQAVLLLVAGRRIGRLLQERRRICPESTAFWNSLLLEEYREIS